MTVTCNPQDLSVFLEHRRGLINYAAKLLGDEHLAEDVVQEAWLRFHNTYSDDTVTEPIGFLFRIVRNLAIDTRRKNNRGPYIVDPFSFEKANSPALIQAITSETTVAARQEVDRLKTAIDALPEKTRTALELHRFQGYKLHEIATVMGISKSRAHELVTDGLARCRAYVWGKE